MVLGFHLLSCELSGSAEEGKRHVAIELLEFRRRASNDESRK